MGADDTEMACCPPLIVAGSNKTSAVGGPRINTNRIFCLQCTDKRAATVARPYKYRRKKYQRYDKISDL